MIVVVVIKLDSIFKWQLNGSAQEILCSRCPLPLQDGSPERGFAALNQVCFERKEPAAWPGSRGLVPPSLSDFAGKFKRDAHRVFRKEQSRVTSLGKPCCLRLAPSRAPVLAFVKTGSCGILP